MEAPTPRKSNRVPISLAACCRALSTSWRLTLLTMSKDESAKAVPPGTLLRNSEILVAGARCHWPARGLARDGQSVTSASQVSGPTIPSPGQAELLPDGPDRVLRCRAAIPVDRTGRAKRRVRRLDPCTIRASGA